MIHSSSCAVGLGLTLLLGSLAAAQRGSNAFSAFHDAHPGTRLLETNGRIARVYGSAFSQGVTAVESGRGFVDNHAMLFGVPPEHLVPIGPFADGRHEQGIMYQPETGTYKFTGLYYHQRVDGVPVFRSQLKLLVRNEAGFPLVLASADLRDLGAFEVDRAAAREALAGGGAQAAMQRAAELAIDAGEPRILSTRKVVYAGAGREVVAPRLADESLVGVGMDEWLVVTDAANGAVLFQEHRIYMVDITGSVAGLATEGLGAEHCNDEVPTPLPYLLVTAGANTAFSDAAGDFVISNPGVDPIDVTAGLDGQWFDVFDFQGSPTTESEQVTPPGPADLVFNAANTDELVRSQVNAYVGINLVRDFVLQYNPTYPTLDLGDFPVTVNRDDFVCPGNAWYSSSNGGSINFCLAAGNFPNTAFSSVIYHEYGHHLVEAAGSGQCAYGEGMSDTVSLLINDSPLFGLGFFGDCQLPLRTGDNSCQYDAEDCTTNCGGPCHSCGQLLSGCVWSTRNNLVVTEPVDYLDILSNIAINAMLVHTGSGIDPSITIDYLTLDDDDANLLNGTPHYHEINNGFSDHGMPGPPVEWLTLNLPGGAPELLSPTGGTTVGVDVSALNATPQEGTGKFYVDTGGGFVEMAMTEVQPNVYDAVFPAIACGTTVAYYFSAEATDGTVTNNPLNAPDDHYVAISAAPGVAFDDNFESDTGWTVSSEGFVSGGAWERADPVGLETCDRGNPGTDDDGSGQCYVTENSDAFDCNSDVDGGTTVLTSPMLDATGDRYIAYSRWLDNTAGLNPSQDAMIVEVSDDNGASWVELETVGPAGPEASGGWFRSSFLIADFVAPTNQFRIRFKVGDADPPSVVEAGVDAVTIGECTAEVCPWDCDNGDGMVGINDFLALLAQWGGPGPCDFDGDNMVGINDLLALLGAWGPCP